MSSESPVTHITLHSAEEFLNAISPRSKYLEGNLDRFSHYFIFRGHADDRWELIPKALRLEQLIDRPLYGWGRVKAIVDSTGGSREQFFQSDDTPRSWSAQDQIMSEWNVLGHSSRWGYCHG